MNAHSHTKAGRESRRSLSRTTIRHKNALATSTILKNTRSHSFRRYCKSSHLGKTRRLRFVHTIGRRRPNNPQQNFRLFHANRFHPQELPWVTLAQWRR